ncbi:UNKNOWN [Stylonychia lemnae]|uniref:Uncharacterized protein n=1 Tax=Stylonychia lemnae TaxID=5949 RepID=A0A078A0E2_STYLE|nr:UNKNOWN [Stylonychia lemnae]|eukprot:CDW74253.1 UNKNOWN [Stylonychia lemnae]
MDQSQIHDRSMDFTEIGAAMGYNQNLNMSFNTINDLNPGSFTDGKSYPLPLHLLDNDHLKKFFTCLSTLSFPECLSMTQSNSGIYEQFQCEGYGGSKDPIVVQFMKLLRELSDFDQKYYTFSYFSDKDLMSGIYQKFQDLGIKLQEQQQLKHNLGNTTILDSQSFTQKLVKIIGEMEFYIRLKNLMMINYKEDLFEKRNDSRLLQQIKELINKLEAGPMQQSFEAKRQRMNQNLEQTPFKALFPPKYEWSAEFKKVKDHFALELKILEQLLRSKRAALKQDHLTAMMCICNINDCFVKKKQELYTKQIKDYNNKYNNLWKWLLTMQFVLISRNRLLLNNFILSQEKQVRELERLPKYLNQSKIEMIKIEQLQQLCTKLGYQRVDILIKIDEAHSLLNFNYDNLLDQGFTNQDIQSRIIQYKNYQYYILYSYSNPNFQCQINYKIVILEHEKLIEKGSVSNLKRDYYRFTFEGVKYYLGKFDDAHYILISQIHDQKVKDADRQQVYYLLSIVNNREHENLQRLNILRSLSMEKYYSKMNQFTSVQSFT